MGTLFAQFKKILCYITVILSLMLTACGSSSGSASSSGGGGDSDFNAEYHSAEYHEDSTQGNSEVQVDLSCVSEGYFGLVANSSSRLKLQVFKGEETFTYDIANGAPQFFPLQCGDGIYTIKVMENVKGNQYCELYSTNATVSLEDSNAPYVRPNVYANYTEESDCVKEAAKIAAIATSEEDFVNRVYQYICKKVKYDYKEAETVNSGYVPDPDEVMNTGKGSCFDYASLAASMLRSQGIPTKIIFGYVAPDNRYHAWNMFYTEETSWTTVEFSVNPGDWTRLDLTFSTNGANADFISDDSNYQDIYQY